MVDEIKCNNPECQRIATEYILCSDHVGPKSPRYHAYCMFHFLSESEDDLYVYVSKQEYEVNIIVES